MISAICFHDRLCLERPPGLLTCIRDRSRLSSSSDTLVLLHWCCYFIAIPPRATLCCCVMVIGYVLAHSVSSSYVEVIVMVINDKETSSTEESFCTSKINSPHDMDLGSYASLSSSSSELAIFLKRSIYQTASVRSHNCTRP
jgi:hypothetical protein